MHHIDRTLQELENAPGLLAGEFENAYEYAAQGEYGQELGQEFAQEFSNEFGQEASFGNQETFETGPTSSQEMQELEMAYQLLEVSNEQELNQFLGDLMQKAAGAVSGAASRFVASPVGQGVGQYLVNFGKNTLPQLATQYGGQAGGALGSWVGQALGGRLGPVGARVGGALGNKAGSWAGSKAGQWAGTQAGNWLASNAQRVFGLELETLSPENQELEIARAYVRFANDVTRRASQVVRQNPNLSIASVGRQVLSAAAPQHAPGLVAGGAAPAPAYAGSYGRRRRSGTWVRQGNTLVLYGA